MAYNQLQTYQRDLPTLFGYTAVCAVSDGLQSRAGTMAAPYERFLPWRTIDGDGLVEVSDEVGDAPADLRRYVELDVLLKGIFDPRRFLPCARATLIKTGDQGEPGVPTGLDTAVRQIVSHALVADGVIDVFAVARMQRPNVSILSEAFLAEVRGMPQRNLALELLRKLLNDAIKARQKTNVVEAKSFTAMLEQSILRY